MNICDKCKTDVIIYGAGFVGTKFLELAQNKINIKCFFDNNENKIGTKIENISVVKPHKATSIDDVIIVSLLKAGDVFNSIKSNLIQLGYVNIYHIFEFRYDKNFFLEQDFLFFLDVELVNQNQDLINKTYDILNDDLSVQTLKDIYDFILKDYNTPIKNLHISEQYFEYGLYIKLDNEVLLDCGAFRGEVFDYFLQKWNAFDKYYIFEPDKSYLPFIDNVILKNNVNSKKVSVNNFALSDCVYTAFIKNYNNENSLIFDNNYNNNYNQIDVNFIDNLNISDEITFIKIDTEGYEKRIIDGAKNTILKYKPVLAVAVYHNISDFWELPLFLKEMLPDYTFYLRSYMNLYETILYAVPPNRTLKNN